MQKNRLSAQFPISSDRYAYEYATRHNAAVMRPSVYASVCHKPVLYQNG